MRCTLKQEVRGSRIVGQLKKPEPYHHSSSHQISNGLANTVNHRKTNPSVATTPQDGVLEWELPERGDIRIFILFILSPPRDSSVALLPQNDTQYHIRLRPTTVILSDCKERRISLHPNVLSFQNHNRGAARSRCMLDMKVTSPTSLGFGHAHLRSELPEPFSHAAWQV